MTERGIFQSENLEKIVPDEVDRSIVKSYLEVCSKLPAIREVKAVIAKTNQVESRQLFIVHDLSENILGAHIRLQGIMSRIEEAGQVPELLKYRHFTSVEEYGDELSEFVGDPTELHVFTLLKNTRSVNHQPVSVSG